MGQCALKTAAPRCNANIRGSKCPVCTIRYAVIGLLSTAAGSSGTGEDTDARYVTEYDARSAIRPGETNTAQHYAQVHQHFSAKTWTCAIRG